MSGFVAALALLTRIPLLRPSRSTPAGSLPWVPVVGGMVGAISGGVYWTGLEVMPSLLASVLAIGSGILLTGALHEDGLADTVDAFGAGARGERALRIMRDPNIGTYGTMALVVTVIWRVAALQAVGGQAAGLAVLVMSHTMGRWGAVMLLGSTSSARSDGLARWASAQTTPVGVWTATAAGLAISAIAGGWWALPGVGLMAIAVLTWRTAAISRIGGVTGDILGACEQTIEMTVMALLAALVWGGSSPWWAG